MLKNACGNIPLLPKTNLDFTMPKKEGTLSKLYSKAKSIFKSNETTRIPHKANLKDYYFSKSILISRVNQLLSNLNQAQKIQKHNQNMHNVVIESKFYQLLEDKWTYSSMEKDLLTRFMIQNNYINKISIVINEFQPGSKEAKVRAYPAYVFQPLPDTSELKDEVKIFPNQLSVSEDKLRYIECEINAHHLERISVELKQMIQEYQKSTQTLAK